MSTPGFLQGRRADLAKGHQTITVDFECVELTAFIVNRDEWVTLPISVDTMEIPELDSSWNDQVLIGVPDFLPEAGRAAYVMYEATLMWAKTYAVAACVEIARLMHDVREEADRQAYLKVRCDELMWLIDYATSQQWYDKKITGMRHALQTLQSYQK